MSWVGASCFSYSQEEKLQQQLASIRHHSPEKFASTVDFCFLGPSKCGKTSLLFQFAYFLAEHGKRVTFVCESSKMQSTLPRYPDGFRPKEDVLHRIFLKYVSSCDELNEFLSSIHNKEEQQLRDVLIVDDLFFLISKEAEKERLARLCWFLALLRETAIFFRGQHELRHQETQEESERSCFHLVVSYDRKEREESMFLRWKFSVISISPADASPRRSTEAARSYTLTYSLVSSPFSIPPPSLVVDDDESTNIRFESSRSMQHREPVWTFHYILTKEKLNLQSISRR